MSNEFGQIHNLNLMPHCVFDPNAHWDFNRQNYTINVVPSEVLRRATSPVNFIQGAKIYKTNRFWEFYYPEVIKPLKCGIVIARDPEYSLNRVIGTKKFVNACFAAYQFLDNIYPGHPFRNMDLIESRPYIRNASGYDPDRQGYYWTKELLKLPDIKILQMAEKYSDYNWNELKPPVGIQSDMPHPAFFLYSFDSTNDRFVIKAAKIASAMVHDYTHHELFVSGYSYHGPRAESLCITNQMNFLSQIITRFCSSVYRKSIPIKWKAQI